jgi:hypothetical protein
MAKGSRRELYTSAPDLAQYEYWRGFEGIRKYSMRGDFERFSLDARKEICKAAARRSKQPRRDLTQCARG